ncbi:MAG: Ig-like domain-containing protein [Bacteroidota bacterium]|nr:Ig-like domain-containing protein [Bacteroidota bacterium]
MRSFRLTVLLTVLLIPPALEQAAAQTFSARPDTVQATADGLAFHQGDLLINDDLPQGDSVQVVVVTPPQNGTLSWDDSGLLTYQPHVGFLGEDRFEYRFQTLPLQHLDVQTSESVLEFSGTLETALGVAEDAESIPVEGSISINIGTDVASVDSVHIADVFLTNPGQHSLRFEYGSPIVVGAIRIEADPGNVVLGMIRPGPPSATMGILRAWEQPDNVSSIAVEATIEGTGLLSSAVPPGTQVLTTEAEESLQGSLVVAGSQLLLILNVDTQHAFDLDGNAVTLAAQGSIQAAGTFVPRIESDAAEVVVHVQASGTYTDSDDTRPMDWLHTEIWPNPTDSSVRIRIGSQRRASMVDVTVFDVLGREVTRFDTWVTPGNEMVRLLDASNWSSGLYFVRFSSEDTQQTRTLMRR